MFSCTGNHDGTVTAECPDPVVTGDLLTKILVWKIAGKSGEDIATALRQETVPSGYTVHKWIAGTVFLQT